MPVSTESVSVPDDTPPSPTPPDLTAIRALMHRREELLQEALLLAIMARVVGQGRDTTKRELGEYLTPGDTLHPKIDGMDAGTVLVTKGDPTIEITDNAAWIGWLLENHPSEVIQVCREVFWKMFIVSGDGTSVVAPDGTMDVPGLSVVPGKPVMRVIPSKDPAVAQALWARFRPTLNELMSGAEQ